MTPPSPFERIIAARVADRHRTELGLAARIVSDVEAQGRTISVIGSLTTDRFRLHSDIDLLVRSPVDPAGRAAVERAVAGDARHRHPLRPDLCLRSHPVAAERVRKGAHMGVCPGCPALAVWCVACQPEHMSLSQVQIIRSLGEALDWFEKELSWNVAPAELRHLTGRIGELYAAMITRGQMALSVNQHGYDVVSAEGHRISVKTITSSNHVTFNKSTFHAASHVMILRLNVTEGEASIEELFRGSLDELAPLCGDAGSSLTYPIRKPASEPVAVDGLAITGSAQIGRWRVVQYENGSIAVETDGRRAPFAKPVLSEIAAGQGISILNGNGNKMNTRQLGAALIASAASISAEQLGWNDDDAVIHDEDGNAIDPRQAK